MKLLHPEDIETALDYVDVIQIGARNMQNFELLKAVGYVNKPVLLKRGLAATIEEFINAAEYIMSRGNGNIILCERGIRTYETCNTQHIRYFSCSDLEKRNAFTSCSRRNAFNRTQRFTYYHVQKRRLLSAQML